MGEAKRRGTYEERKASPLGKKSNHQKSKKLSLRQLNHLLRGAKK